MYKEIHWDKVITEFGYKDDALHIHFRRGPKFSKDFSRADEIIDTYLKNTFHKEIRPTGKIIEEAMPNKEIVYSADFNENIKFQKPSKYQRKDLPQVKPEEFQQAQDLHKKLLKLYESTDVIHKTYTGNLAGKDWEDLASWGYIVYNKTPFIDDIMIKMCEQIEKDLG